MECFGGVITNKNWRFGRCTDIANPRTPMQYSALTVSSSQWVSGRPTNLYGIR
jgi:hypothetical protein